MHVTRLSMFTLFANPRVTQNPARVEDLDPYPTRGFRQ